MRVCLNGGSLTEDGTENRDEPDGAFVRGGGKRESGGVVEGEGKKDRKEDL